MKRRIHQNLEVYQLAYGIAVDIFNLSRSFPKDEIYSMTSQIVRSSRSVCANIAEAYRKRRYPNSFVAKLSDAEAEASETQTWISFCNSSGYIDEPLASELIRKYDQVIGMLVNMARHPEKWKL